MGRLLSGRLDLKLRHILDICRVIELYPQEFFRIVFKDADRRSPLLQRLDTLTNTYRTRTAVRSLETRPPAADLDEVTRLLSELLRRLESLASNQRPSRSG